MCPVLVQHDPDTGVGRPVLGPTGLERDGGLESAVYLSLFLDARAEPGDELDDPKDRRGFWGETYGFRGGSRLWLRRRLKREQATLDLVSADAKQALQWLIDDGVAAQVTATAENSLVRDTQINLTVEIERADGSRWASYWENVA